MRRLAWAELRADPWLWAGPAAVCAVTAAFLQVVLVFGRVAVAGPGSAVLVAAGGTLEDDLAGTIAVAVATVLPAVLVLSASASAVVVAMGVRVARWRLAGAGPGRVALVVVTQVATVAALGAAAGVAASTPTVGPGVDLLARMATGTPTGLGARQDLVVGVVTVAATVVVSVVGAVRPAVRAVRVPAVLAVRSAEAAERRRSPVRAVLAGGCAVLAWTLVTGAAAATDLGDGLGSALSAGAVLVATVAAAAPWLVPAVGALGRLVPARLAPAWWLTRADLAASPRRAVALVLPPAVASGVVGVVDAQLATWQTALDRAGAGVQLNLVDTVVLVAPAVTIGLVGGLAQAVLSTRAREREWATARCAGATGGALLRCALALAVQVAGAAALLAAVPTGVTAVLVAGLLDRTGTPAVPTVHPLVVGAVVAAGAVLLGGVSLLSAVRVARANPRRFLGSP